MLGDGRRSAYRRRRGDESWTTAMTSKLPKQSEFQKFWNYELSPLRFLLGLAIYFMLLIAYSLSAPWLVPNPSFVVFGFLAVAIGVPGLLAKWYWKRYDRFLRCPHCRDWVGRDVSGTFHGPNPKWRTVLVTRQCFRCGANMLSENSALPVHHAQRNSDDTILHNPYSPPDIE